MTEYPRMVTMKLVHVINYILHNVLILPVIIIILKVTEVVEQHNQSFRFIVRYKSHAVINFIFQVEL